LFVVPAQWSNISPASCKRGIQISLESLNARGGISTQPFFVSGARSANPASEHMEGCGVVAVAQIQASNQSC
jgi:hypothetical protein